MDIPQNEGAPRTELMSIGRSQDAGPLTMSSRAIALTDNNPTYLDTHAWVLFKLGRTAEAKKVMQQAIALDGQESAALLVHYGDILHAMGEQFMAEIYWRKGLEKGYDADQITRRMEQGKAEKE